MIHPSRRFAATLAFCAVTIAVPTIVCADGWHNAALTTSSLDQWMADVKDVMPKLQKQREDTLKSRELRSGKSLDDLRKLASGNRDPGEQLLDDSRLPRGGKLQSNLTPVEEALLQRKAAASLEVLAFMDPKNIYPREFPNFDLRKIPQYRSASKELLKSMGPLGASTVAAQIRAALMGSLPGGADISVSEQYMADLVEVFDDAITNEQLSPEDVDSLLEAAQGEKPLPIRRLADHVQSSLSKYVDIALLIEWREQATDRTSKARYDAMLRQRLGKAASGELLKALGHPELDETTKRLVITRMSERLREAGIYELLTVLDDDTDSRLKQAASAELAKRSPRYSEVKDELANIIPLTRSEEEAVARSAAWQIANAFQRAPISECFTWLAKTDKQTDALIWQQIDGRIARADAERRAEYAQVAMATITSRDAAAAEQVEALELLTHLEDRSQAGPLVELMPQMPRELWPATATTLRGLTGQGFGPMPGDGIVESTVAIKKWQDWWRENSGR